MKTVKYIVFALMCVLLVMAAVLGYMVFDHVMDLFQPSTPPSTTAPSSSASVPESTIPSVSVHHCDYTIKGETHAPTCDALGYTVYACVCGQTDFKDYVPALEHIYSEYTVIAPTCTEEGWSERSCSRCKQVERTNFIPVTHQFGPWEETRNYWKYVCTGCGFFQQYSTESGPVWMMEITPLENVGEYVHLQLFLALNGDQTERTYDLYIGLPEQIPEFDYLNQHLIVTYLIGEEYLSQELSLEMLEATIHSDGTMEPGAPALLPDTETEPEPEA